MQRLKIFSPYPWAASDGLVERSARPLLSGGGNFPDVLSGTLQRGDDTKSDLNTALSSK
jgi:hypothetical protein